jgi:hypothetical protein
VTFLISRAAIFFSPEARALRAALAMRLKAECQSDRSLEVNRKDMGSSLLHEEDVVEIGLYKSEFQLRIRKGGTL